MVRRRLSGSTTQTTSTLSTKTNGIELSQSSPPAKRLRQTRSGREEKIESSIQKPLILKEKAQDEVIMAQLIEPKIEEIPSTSTQSTIIKEGSPNNEQAQHKTENSKSTSTSMIESTQMAKPITFNHNSKRMVAQRSDNPYAKILEKPTWQHPEWSEAFRGILITLVEQRGVDLLMSPHLLQATAIGKNMIRFKSIAELLGGGMDCAPTENIVLEKWAWLCEMNYRSHMVAQATGMMRWRFANAMKNVPTQENAFLGILSEDRFDQLCDLFKTTDQDNLMRNEYRLLFNEVSKKTPTQLHNFATIALASSSNTKITPKEASKAPKLPAPISNGHSTITFVHEPTVREALNARRAKQMVDSRKGHLNTFPTPLSDPDISEFERLCGVNPIKDPNTFWTKALIRSLVNEVRPNGKVLEDPTSKEFHNLVGRLRKEHNASWLTVEECRNRLLELFQCSTKLSQKPRIQLGFELQSIYALLQSAALQKTTDVTASSNHFTEPSTSAQANSVGMEVKREVETDATNDSLNSPSSTTMRTPTINIVEFLNEALQGQVNPGSLLINGENVWVPPKEEVSGAKTTATATATIMVKPLESNQVISSTARSRGRASTISSTFAPSQASPTNTINPIAKPDSHRTMIPTASTIFTPTLSPSVDKWTLLGQLIAEQARDLERTKGTGAAMNFQKALTDLIASNFN